MNRRGFLKGLVAAPAIPYVPALEAAVKVESLKPIVASSVGYIPTHGWVDNYDAWVCNGVDWPAENVKWMGDILGACK